LQLLVGFVRPPAARSLTRSLWQLFHALLGRMAVMLGMINVMIGIYLFGTLYRGECAERLAGCTVYHTTLNLYDAQVGYGDDRPSVCWLPLTETPAVSCCKHHPGAVCLYA
jgi:hypothetical protein